MIYPTCDVFTRYDDETLPPRGPPGVTHAFQLLPAPGTDRKNTDQE